MEADKVFDVVGRLFEGVSLRQYMEQATTELGADQAEHAILGALTKEQVKALQAHERRLYGDGGDVKRELPRLRASLEEEVYRRLMPGYVRHFVEQAAPRLDLAVEGDLDAVTTYYLLHRHDFGVEPAPVGPCILYAVSCGLRDSDLSGRYDLLARGGGSGSGASAAAEEDDEAEDAEDGDEDEAEKNGSSGATVKLKAWNARKRVGMAADGDGRPVPLIDRTHRLMQLWRAGDVAAADDYLDTHGLRRSPLFHHLLQSLIELSSVGSEERSLLESISNHVNARAAAEPKVEQLALLSEG
jgi:hypothetical protein